MRKIILINAFLKIGSGDEGRLFFPDILILLRKTNKKFVTEIWYFAYHNLSFKENIIFFHMKYCTSKVAFFFGKRREL